MTPAGDVCVDAGAQLRRVMMWQPAPDNAAVRIEDCLMEET